MANWLLLYSLGCVPAMLAVALLAFQRRESHCMSLPAVGQLVFSAGMVWPLLLVAGLQAAVLLVLKALLGSIRSGVRSSSAPQPVEVPALVSIEPVVSAPTALAA